MLYVLAYCGTALAGRQALAILAGVGVAGLFIIAVGYLLKFRAGAFRDSAAWVSLAAFTLLSELETAVGRVGFGVAQATASRYTTADILFVIATMVFCFQAYFEWSARVHPSAAAPGLRWIRIALLIILTGAIVRSYWAGVDGSRVYRARDLQGQACMATATQASHDCLNVLAANEADFVYSQLVYLRSQHLVGQHPISGG